MSNAHHQKLSRIVREIIEAFGHEFEQGRRNACPPYSDTNYKPVTLDVV